MSGFGAEMQRGSGLGWFGWKTLQLEQGLICSWGLNSRFLKIPGKIIQDKDSRLEQLESQERERMDFKEEMLEISP